MRNHKAVALFDYHNGLSRHRESHGTTVAFGSAVDRSKAQRKEQ
jgi:hypothetical protein